jgi:hypothetical protein
MPSKQLAAILTGQVKGKEKPKMFRGNEPAFEAACCRANGGEGVRPTHRQWRKWCQKRGAAYNAR